MVDFKDIYSLVQLEELSKIKFEELEQKQLEINKINSQIKWLKSLSSDQYVAIFLHDLFCRSDHDEHCEWMIREHDWDSPTHKRYLEYAQDLLNLFTDSPNGKQYINGKEYIITHIIEFVMKNIIKK